MSEYRKVYIASEQAGKNAYTWLHGNEFIIDWDKNMTIDTFSKNNLREEIVRCRDCKYYGCYDGSAWCSRTYEQVPGGVCDYQTVEPEGFCAWGERKQDERDS